MRRGSSPFEIIILSSHNTKWYQHQRFPLDTSDNSKEKYYNVLLLGWDQALAERRGIGLLEKTAITRGLPPGPIWTEINQG